MFGYIRTYRPSLYVWEDELYNGIYCGLCVLSGKRNSYFTKLLLNYDFVLLAIVRMALSGEKVSMGYHFCPYKMKKMITVQPNKSLEYTADAFALLIHGKLMDDFSDSKLLGKLAVVPDLLIRSDVKRSARQMPELLKGMNDALKRLSALEKSGEGTIDGCAACFGDVMAHIASYGFEGSLARISKEIGFHVGRYIYIIDALDDFNKDLRSGNFNPLVKYYGTKEELLKNIDDVKITLSLSMDRAYSAFTLVSSEDYGGLIENILLRGSEERIREVSKKLIDN